MKPTVDDAATTAPHDEHFQPGVWRASDSDREAVARVVQEALTSGMLTMIEAEERLVGVYGARFRHELEPITADLPIVQQPRVGQPPVRWIVRVDRWVQCLATGFRDLASGHRKRAFALALLAAALCVTILLFGAADFVSD